MPGMAVVRFTSSCLRLELLSVPGMAVVRFTSSWLWLELLSVPGMSVVRITSGAWDGCSKIGEGGATSAATAQ